MKKLNHNSLLVPMFQRIIYDKWEVELNEEKCLRKYARDIECMGHLFLYLGLAVFDNETLVGWEPTNRMMEFVVLRLMSPSKPPLRLTVNHPFMLTLLRDAALRQTGFADHDPWLAFGVMEALGLVRLDRDGENYLATDKLVYLFEQALYRERQKEQLQPIQMH